MSNEDKMTIDERSKYLHRMKKRYLKASRKERRQLLDEMEMVTDLHRKSLIRLMNGTLERTPRHGQRDRTYRLEPMKRTLASSSPSAGPMSFQRMHTPRKGADSFGKVFI